VGGGAAVRAARPGRLYRSDAEDGSLEQMLMSPVPLAWLLAMRIAGALGDDRAALDPGQPGARPSCSTFRAALLAPLLLSLALGTPLLSLVGAVVAALTVGIRRSGMILAVLALPLYVPVLVFGAGRVVAAAQGCPGSARSTCSAPAWRSLGAGARWPPPPPSGSRSPEPTSSPSP
jgi:heme exporter protein B